MYKDEIYFLNELDFISGDNRYSYWYVDDNFSNELDCIGDDANKYSYWHVDDNSEPDDGCNREHNKHKCNSHVCDKCHRYHRKKVCATGATGITGVTGSTGATGATGPDVGATGISYTPGVTNDWYWDLYPELPTTVQGALDQLAHQLYVLLPVTTVALGTAGNYVVLAKSAISNIPTSNINGNIGISPAPASSITGFSLTTDPSGTFSTSNQVSGNVYATNDVTPTPEELTTAIIDMQTAYTDAAIRTSDYIDLNGGSIGNQTLSPAVYKWNTGVTINADVTLDGGTNSVWIFQIAQGITQSIGTHIILTGGAQAKNIFWQSAGSVMIGTNSHFEGVILDQTSITMMNGASINGILLSQTTISLDSNTVTVF